MKHVVLYIEDDAANRELVRFILARRSDLSLLEAADGTSGLEMAKNESPDLILLDLSLPDFSGYEVLKNLQQQPSTSTIPVVALTGDSSPDDMQRGLSAGFRGYLTKPIMMQNLYDMIDSVIS